MSEKWRDVTLSDFVALQRGHDLTEPERRPGNVPVMGSAGQNGFHDTTRAKGPGIVIGRSGASFGQVHFSPDDYWPHNTALYVTDFKGNDPKFAYYFLKAINFSRYNSGSAQPSLNRNFIYPIPVRIPPLPEQKRIAHILGTLDDKIELNRRMNATLEAMARALFQSWFVDSADEGIKEVVLGELVSHTRKAISPANFPEEVFDHYSLPAFDAGKLPVKDAGNAIKSNKTLVPADAVLLSKLNPRIPRVWLPNVGRDSRSITSTEFLVVQPNKNVSREFLYGLFTSPAFLQTLEGMVTGTSGSHQRVKPDAALHIPVSLPPVSVIERYTRAVEPMLRRSQANLEESHSLGELRDSLLPKLLS